MCCRPGTMVKWTCALSFLINLAMSAFSNFIKIVVTYNVNWISVHKDIGILVIKQQIPQAPKHKTLELIQSGRLRNT